MNRPNDSVHQPWDMPRGTSSTDGAVRTIFPALLAFFKQVLPHCLWPQTGFDEALRAVPAKCGPD